MEENLPFIGRVTLGTSMFLPRRMEGMYRVLKSVELKSLGMLLNKAESENAGAGPGGKGFRSI